MEKTKDFGIKEMAQMLGIHDYDIKLILGIPLSLACNATTIASAYHDHTMAPKNSEAKVAAWKKINELYLSNLDEAETLEEVQIVRILCPSGSLSKEEAMLKEISLCVKLKEINELENSVLINANSKARKAYLKRKSELSLVPGDFRKLIEECPEKSEIIQEVNDKWYSSSYHAISTVRSYEEMEKIFYDLSPKVLVKALVKWQELCINAREVQKLYRMIFDKRAPYRLFHEAFMENMYSRWIGFSFDEIDTAQNFDQAMAAQAATPEDSLIRIKASEKCLGFASTVDLVKEVYVYAPNNYELKMKIFMKWLLLVGSIREAKELYIFFSDKGPRPEDRCQEYVVLDRTEIILAITKKIATFYGYQAK
ncbi:MAG: hypothetical protein ACOYL8_00300 [Patescibacteria group bacterium]